jgi:glucosyl-3-phosphoglycerate phosphatase
MPLELLLVRHGESVGNVARAEAETAGADVIALEVRDADVPLSELGIKQAGAVGRWLAESKPDLGPLAWCSPYRRARQTAEIALQESGSATSLAFDERLRDRELGVLDMLTSKGVRERFPEERARREWLGKLYYRPPGGESWCDVALRLRSFLAGLLAGGTSDRVLIVTHDAVILLFRYICELWDEQTLLTVASASSVLNASITELKYSADSHRWQAVSFNSHDHLLRYGAVTS